MLAEPIVPAKVVPAEAVPGDGEPEAVEPDRALPETDEAGERLPVVLDREDELVGLPAEIPEVGALVAEFA